MSNHFIHSQNVSKLDINLKRTSHYIFPQMFPEFLWERATCMCRLVPSK